MTENENVDVAVVGAGPYGLTATAHLREDGLRVATFGGAMDSWRDGMPPRMVLRSTVRASSIAHPRSGMRMEDWAAETGRTLRHPIPMREFLDYTSWWAGRAVPDVDSRRVVEVAVGTTRRFDLHLDDGGRLAADRVVFALGFTAAAHRPVDVGGVADGVVAHVADNPDLEALEGQRVVVIGTGQSALETAAISHEAGAAVQIVGRSPRINWLAPVPPPGSPETGLLRKAPTDVGGFVTGWLAAAPDAYHALPRKAKRWVQAGCLRPAGAHILRARLADVPMLLGRGVDKISAAGEQAAEVLLDDGTVLTADRVLLGTGYQVDALRFGVLSPELAAGLEHESGAPVLRSGFESSIPGLHFMGAAAVQSFGPINRFVTGTWYAGPALRRRCRGRRGPAGRLAF
jgi:cation diffusion facilitator CzcD-associated flavoprotein CzcO